MNAAQEAVPLPERMLRLCVDHRGYRVPAFVEWVDGKPDFRIVSSMHLRDCVRYGLCWICGVGFGDVHSFVIGPMCAVNRVSAEPPSHHDCATYAAKVCPFLTMPKALRRAPNLPEHREAPGVAIKRNPGCAAARWSGPLPPTNCSMLPAASCSVSANPPRLSGGPRGVRPRGPKFSRQSNLAIRRFAPSPTSRGRTQSALDRQVAEAMPLLPEAA